MIRQGQDREIVEDRSRAVDRSDSRASTMSRIARSFANRDDFCIGAPDPTLRLELYPDESQTVS